MNRILCVTLALMCATNTDKAKAETLFESGTLGSTGISYAELGGMVPGTDVNSSIFAGVRFELMQPVVTSQVGGHFVEQVAGTFFGAIVALDDENDFPNSNDLSTQDLVGATTLSYPNPSAEVFGSLSLSLDPGWYALIFGSGLFGTGGSGGAVRNGTDTDDPSYIGFGPNLGWFNFDTLAFPFDNHRFVITGQIVPEPSSVVLTTLAALSYLIYRRQ